MKKLATITMAALALAILPGCATQSSDPMQRSNESTYQPKAEINITGDHNSVIVESGDGLYASADGGGDRQRATPTQTQTTDTKPEIAFSMPGGSAGTGSAQPGGNILDRALNKVSGWVGGGTKTPLTKQEADALKDCIDCNIAPSE